MLPARKSSVFFPRMWRGFGQDANEPPAQQTDRNYFRPRISSISGMLHNVAVKGGRLLHSPPTRQTEEGGLAGPGPPSMQLDDHYAAAYPHSNAVYPYSSRQSIDSVTFHSYLPVDIDGKSSTFTFIYFLFFIDFIYRLVFNNKKHV